MMSEEAIRTKHAQLNAQRELYEALAEANPDDRASAEVAKLLAVIVGTLEGILAV